MPTALERVYQKTHYRVQAGGIELCYRIGQYDAQAEVQLIRFSGDFRQWVLITPCNPASVALCQEENNARLENLHHWLSKDTYRWLCSRNHDPAGAWPDEPGALILDIALSEAKVLGQQFGQNALVYAELGQAPELVWL